MLKASLLHSCNYSLLNLIILAILPPSDEGGVSEADGGREKQIIIVNNIIV